MTLGSLAILNSELGLFAMLLAVPVAWTATYVLLRRTLNHEIGLLRAEIQRATIGKSAPIPTVSRASAAIDLPKASAPDNAPDRPSATQLQQNCEEVAHETLVVIAAAVSAFLGKSVRLRSARLVHPSEGNAWAQQGRVFVQASHNLGMVQRQHG
jgi:methylmalonyl-CoA carboxyltransferase 12S subunit